MMDMLVGAILVMAGYMLCWFTHKTKKVNPTEKKKAEAEKVITSFKNPLQPYEKVKNSDGLYIPQKPKGVGHERKEG